MNFDRLVLRLDEVSQLVDVRVQDELSSMFQSMDSSLWCATKIREQHSGDSHALKCELLFAPIPEVCEKASNDLASDLRLLGTPP